ncbi:hypothetical protein LOC68_22660 [Blastopirellula sp. JC732]|uniref:Uncharacterized protein n=1 Tax=Blastopirellula sediminis TaxID=2894196 RepID=A0A9X1MTB1_9BACT|nr:hypothetical protein [Blastopirellula sediminis]MCC9605496.1 hypothetical protein [Blastopirellula sediminis]MCC9631204.1 hypothetical protein [Blastopirellula sediminis]
MSTSETPPPKNRPQFRIRHLLIAMVILGVIMAIVAPFVRVANANQWMLMGAACAGLALGTGIFHFGILIPRRLTRKNAGTPLITLFGGGYTLTDWASLRGGVFVVAFWVFVRFASFWNEGATLSNSAFQSHRLFEMEIVFGILAVLVGHLFVPAAEPQLCENGLLWGAYLVPWQSLKIIRGGMLDPLYLRMSYTPDKKIRVRADQREQVEAILRERRSLFDNNRSADFSE